MKGRYNVGSIMVLGVPSVLVLLACMLTMTNAFTSPAAGVVHHQRGGQQAPSLQPYTPMTMPMSTPRSRFALYATTVKPDKEAENDILEAERKAEMDHQLATPTTDDLMSDELFDQVNLEAETFINEMIDETCEVSPEGDSGPLDELCVDKGFRQRFKDIFSRTLSAVRSNNLDEEIDAQGNLLVSTGEALEQGWETRANSSALRRNAEVTRFALAAVFRVLKPRKMRAAGKATEEEIFAAQTEAAVFVRDGLLTLGPSFVKLGQVLSTRTDVLPKTYTDVLLTLTDEVPGFSGKRAKEIVSRELGRPFDEVFKDFSAEPLKAASLGQVHTAIYKGQKVAIKVQRAGLKELFDIDLKNLKKLAVLLDKFDPKSDGADRDWVKIYEESERLLYLEIDYLHEAKNTDRFAKDFEEIDWVRVPKVIREVTTPRVLVMEYVESLKLTDIAQIEKLGLDRKLLAKRVADAFVRQIVETSYFHADPHSGNMAVDTSGNLVFYDYGLMDSLGPNVRSGFRKFCTALFAGGPTISDAELAKNAKLLVSGVEEAGVLAKGADTLAVEKLARYFMRTFKDKQLGKTGTNIKETIGTDLQTLTENNVFRFPSTFTFIFRAFASVDGIGKELDPDFDIGKLAQPAIEKFAESQKGYRSPSEKTLDIFKKATGLNTYDIEKAISQPRKVAYIEETLRSIADGSLKVRVRSLENEKSLERMGMRQTFTENFLIASVFINVAGFANRSLVRYFGVAGAAFFLGNSLMANIKLKKFDKTQLKYEQTSFVQDEKDDE